MTIRLSGQLPPQVLNDKLDSMEAVGLVGRYRVGLNYTVRRNTEFVTAHYFYLSQSKDILLTGTVNGESVLLHGADGANFDLHFIGNGSNGKEPLTFYNSVGLRGTWSLGIKELPAEFSFSHSTENPGQRMYSQVTTQSDLTFEEMVEATKQAILRGDAGTTAKYVHFPLSVNASHRRLIVRDADTLKAHWSTIFSRDFLAKLRLDITHDMFVHEGEAMLGNGELWFDDKGLIAVNPVSTPRHSK